MSTPFVFCEVEVRQLRFDPNNPRLPPNVKGDDEAAVLEWMLADATLLELMGSIAQHGYFPGDPLLLSPWEEDADAPEYKPDVEYKVVEGNRRLAALKLLSGAAAAPRRRKSVAAMAEDASAHNLDVVPGVVFAHRVQLLNYLGFRHITGIKEWDPLEKARFLRELRDLGTQDGKTPSNRELARTIGSKGPYVGRLLAALKSLELLAKNPDFELEVDDVPFSLLVAALNHDGIARHFLRLEQADDPDLTGLDEAALQKLGTWLYVRRAGGKTPLEESRNLGMLSDIVQHDRAVAEFDGGMPIRNAALLAHSPDEVLIEALNQTRGPLNIADEQAGVIEIATAPVVEAAGEIKATAQSVEQKVLAKAAK